MGPREVCQLHCALGGRVDVLLMKQADFLVESAFLSDVQFVACRILQSVSFHQIISTMES